MGTVLLDVCRYTTMMAVKASTPTSLKRLQVPSVSLFFVFLIVGHLVLSFISPGNRFAKGITSMGNNVYVGE